MNYRKELWWRLSLSYDTQCPGLSHRLGAVLDAQFAIDVAGMNLYGVQREIKPVSDFLIGQPFSDELQHFQFALAERFNEIVCGP